MYTIASRFNHPSDTDRTDSLDRGVGQDTGLGVQQPSAFTGPRSDPKTGTVRIPLTQGQYAVVDAQDSALLAAYRWTALRSNNTWYAKSHSGGKTIYMHRLILFGEEESGETRKADHRNGNGLDNRRENLRPVTHSQNMRNTVGRRATRRSEYKGVSVRKNSPKPYRACIHIDGEQKHLGYFDSEWLAGHVYDLAAKKFFGPFARTNSIRFRVIGQSGMSLTKRFRLGATAVVPGWRYRLKVDLAWR